MALASISGSNRPGPTVGSMKNQHRLVICTAISLALSVSPVAANTDKLQAQDGTAHEGTFVDYNG